MDTHSPWPWLYVELRPPTLNRKFTKLFLSLLLLCVFSDFTFAAEHRVHGFGLKQIRSSRPKDDTVDDLTSENNVAFDDDFLRQAEQNIDVTEGNSDPAFARRILTSFQQKRKRDERSDEDDHPVMEVLIQKDPLMRYYENLNIGLALELFYYPTERNFYDSKWHDFYAKWSIESKERYQNYLRFDKTLPPLTFFAMDTLDSRFVLMRCGFEYKEGCVNMPTLTDVRIARKEDRHSARAILYTLLIHQRTFADMHIFVSAIDAARERLQGYCDEFAHTFFHQATHHTVKMCAMEIVNIVMGVIMAVLTIVSVGMCVATFVGLAGIVAAAAGETALLEGLGTVASVFANTGGGILAAEGAGLVAEGAGLVAEGAGTAAEAGAAVAEGAGAIASVEVAEGIAGSGIAGSEAFEMGTAEGLMFGADTTGGSGLGQFGTSLERVDSVFSTYVGYGGKVAQGVGQSGQVGTAGRLSGTEIGAEILDAANAASAAGDGSVGNAGSLSFSDAVRAQAVAGLVHTYGEAPAWLTGSGSRVGLHVPNQASAPLRWHSAVTNPSVGARAHLRQLLTQATSAFALSSLVPSRLSTIVESEELESPDITWSGNDRLGNEFTASEESVLGWQAQLFEFNLVRDRLRTGNEMSNNPWPDTARIYLPEQPEVEAPTQRRPFNPEEYPPNPDGHPTTLRDRVREFLSSIRSRYHRWQDGRWLHRYEAQWDEALRTLEPSTAEERLAEARKAWEDHVKNTALGTDIYLAENDNVLWSTLPRLAGGSRPHLRPQPSLPRSPRSSERRKRSEQKFSSSSPRPQVMFSEIESFPYEDLTENLTSVYDIPSMKDGFISIATERIVAKPPPRQKSATSSRPKSSLKDSNNTASKANNRTNTSTPKTPPKAHKNFALGKAPKHMVSRVTPIFAMIPGADRTSSQILQSNDIWDLGARLSPRFTYSNGSLMNGYVAPYYVEDNAYAIAYYIEQLRKTSTEFPYEDDIESVLANMQRSKENPEWRILNEVKHQPWADVLGSMQFEGVHAEGAKSDPTLQFKWNPVQHKSSKKSSTSGHRKRETIHDFSNGHLLGKHQFSGLMRLLSAINLASPRQGRKRSTSEWTMDPDQLTRNMFNVRIGNERFTNPIKHEECSTDNYTGDTEENEKTCRNILQSKCEEVTDRIKSSLSQLNNPKWVMDNWEPSQPSPVSFYLQDRYPTYANLLAFQSIGRHPEFLKNALFNNLKNTLVTKAYADGKCYLKCSTSMYPWDKGIGRRNIHQFGDATCLSGCYDPTEQRFEAPYGLDPNMRFLDAQKEPWNVSERLMSQVSHKLYENRDPMGYLPGDFRLNPYERSVRDITPILPVCQSQYLNIAVDNEDEEMGQFPCSCGDRYGSESVRFWSASSWRPGYYHYEYDIIKDCRHGPLKSLAANYPAAYIVNFCQIVYIAVAPLGSGSQLEEENEGSHVENSQFCAKALEFYQDNRNRPDEYLNSNMCKIWSKYAEGKHKEGGHNDFSYVNHDLRKGGCRPWKHYWEDKHTCKEGRKSCDFPDGY